ncbi:glycosyltransferase [Runella sp.]|uniref:glycosyltransferase n=1 Tax=Runella sp. TaxID=1960881 RepID=UPI002634C4EF|nr:glycosyltransferase [Runella sp.]
MSNEIWDILYLPGRFPRKALAIIGGLFKRFFLLFTLKKYDFIFIHREATPIGPAFFEYFAARWLKKKIIYDFDDAIWIPNYSEANSFFSFLKGYSNVKHICKWVYKISCGNEYLCDYARQFNKNVVYNPTTIDTENYHNKVKNQDTDNFVIGWTGSHSTIRYIEEVIPVLSELEEKYTFQFMVISDLKPTYNLKSLVYHKWNKHSEIEDLLKFNIGIMPLKDDKWANGKCGFKALQYMALGIPALVSPVGVNTRIVDDKINGFICTSPEDWKNAIEAIMKDKSLNKEIAKNTRIKIENHYSVKSNTANFIDLFS